MIDEVSLVPEILLVLAGCWNCWKFVFCKQCQCGLISSSVRICAEGDWRSCQCGCEDASAWCTCFGQVGDVAGMSLISGGTLVPTLLRV